jgi:hypothetical protein
LNAATAELLSSSINLADVVVVDIIIMKIWRLQTTDDNRSLLYYDYYENLDATNHNIKVKLFLCFINRLIIIINLLK